MRNIHQYNTSKLFSYLAYNVWFSKKYKTKNNVIL